MNELYMKAAAEMSADEVKQMHKYISQNNARSVNDNSADNGGKNSIASASLNSAKQPRKNAAQNTSKDRHESMSELLSQKCAENPASNAAAKVPANAGASTGADPTAGAYSSSPSRTRQKQSHDWPEIGTVLYAEYFGQRYRATVIKAKKKLLSGKQVKLQNGPAAEEILDSLSAAMLKATESQRQRMGLRRKGVANGWDFWQWDGK